MRASAPESRRKEDTRSTGSGQAATTCAAYLSARARFRMIARREADDGGREARTQGAPVSKQIRERLRTQHRGTQRRIATWPLILKRALLVDERNEPVPRPCAVFAVGRICRSEEPLFDLDLEHPEGREGGREGERCRGEREREAGEEERSASVDRVADDAIRTMLDR